ncbi:hypothetical protein EWF20_11865 [Sulfolobus sp. S-194]|nr:hypothetical protein EWF20_11865 [Sulfolobus sp. S-194]
METITIDEKALYDTPLNEGVKELGQNLTLLPNPENALLNKSVKEIEDILYLRLQIHFTKIITGHNYLLS